MSWRFFSTWQDGQGGEVMLDPDLPLESVEISHVLSGPTHIKATVAPEVGRLVGGDGLPIFLPWSTTIYAEKDGVIRAGAILTEMSATGEKLELDCTGFSGYLKDMPFTSEYRGYNLDPMGVARIIWNHVQSQKMGNLGLVLTDGASPVRIGKRGQPALRGRPDIKDPVTGEIALKAIPATPATDDEPYELAWYQTADLFKEFNDLAELTPFDYYERHYWLDEDACEIQHVLDMKYPKIGTKREDLRFVVGENIYVAPNLAELGEMYASDVWVLGAGEGSKMAHGYATDYSQGRLRRVSVSTWKHIGKNETASAVARNEVRFKAGRIDFDEIMVVNSPLAEYGNIHPGDEILVQVGNGWYGRVDKWVRIVELTVSPHRGDEMRLLVLKEDAD